MQTFKKPIFDAQGRPHLLIGMYVDITERKQAEEALLRAHDELEQRVAERTKELRTSDEALRGILSATRDGYWCVNARGDLLEVNPRYVQQSGYSREELLGMNITDLDPQVSPAMIAESSQRTTTQGSDQFESIHRRKDGTTWHIEASTTRSGVAGEKFCVFLRDITGRKQAEEELREAEERHRGLVESTFDGSVIHQDGSIVVVSGTYAKMFGYTVEELIGKPVLELIAPEVRDAVADITRQHDAAPYETVGLRKDGSRFAIEAAGRICTHRGQSARIAAVRDITARKQMEEEVGRKNRFLSLLHQLGHSLSTLASPADIPERISTLIGQVFDNRNLYIALFDEATGGVSFPIYRIAGEIRDNLVQRPLGNGLTEYVIRTRTPLLISDRMHEALAERGIALIGTPSRCYLGAPMLIGDRVLGVIAVQDYEQANAYDSSHVELLSTIASDAAIALSNVRLLESIRGELAERQRVEVAMRESEARLTHAMEQAQLAYWEMDAATNTFTFNDRFYALYATTAEREGGYRMTAEDYARKFLPPEEQHVIPEDIAKLMSGEIDELKQEHHIRRREGELRDIVVRIAVLRDASGRVVGTRGSNQDITARKRAEAALKESEERFQHFMDRLPGLAYIKDANGRVLFANNGFANYLGMEWQNFQGKTNRELFPSDFAQRIDEDDQQTLASGTVREIEENFSDRFWMTRKFPIIIANAAPLLGGITLDITARKQAEEALREAMKLAQEKSALLRSIMESPLGINIFSLDCSYRYTEFTLSHRETIKKIWGREIEIGMNLLDVISDPTDRAKAKNNFDRALQGEYLHVEEEYGESISYRTHYENRYSPIFVGSGSVTGLTVFVLDITARKQAEAALLRSEERLRLVIQGSNDALWDWNLESNLLYYSPRWWAMIGYEVDELPVDGDLWKNLLHPADRSLVDRVFGGALKTGPDAYELEFRLRHKDGHYVPILTRGLILRNESGKPVRVAGTNTDLTARKRAEAEKEKLEGMNRQLQKSESLGRMAGAIAHHFNNQLQAVMLGLEMATSDLPRNAEPLDGLSLAMQSARKAAEVSTLMLTYLGQGQGKHEPLELAEVCLRSLPLLRAAMPRSVVLETDLPSPGPGISANANQLQLVLTNLITNAWEASGDGQGTIRLSVKTVAAADISATRRFPIDSQTQEGAYACLEVADAGCGIAAKDIDKLFDPFFSTKFTGRGLGLSVVLGIARSHDGFVTVESEPGRGSTFRVYFPVSAEAVSLKPVNVRVDPISENVWRGATVLVVEDEPAVRKTLALVLRQSGFTVLEAEDGVAAVEIFRQHRDEIGCVVCDLTMPRMNGWETLAALRQLVPGIPVILASGYSEAQAMEGDHPERPQAFLHKPYETKALINVINQVLAARKP